MTSSNPFLENKHEIKWNLINAFLVGLIAFLSSVTTEFTNSGTLSPISFFIGFASFLMVAVVKFSKYWESQEGEYKTIMKNLFNLI